MLSAFFSKYCQFLRLINTTKCLDINNCFYTTCPCYIKFIYIQKVTLLHNHLTSKTSNVQKFNITNKSNNFTNTMGEEGDRNLNADYDDILKAQNDHKVLIIDVRDVSEVKETGKLPGSIHIPMADVSIALTNLSNQAFEEKYKRKKPTHDTKIILSCKSGRRSALVQSSIQKLGYKNALNYTGGWLDWESKQKV